MIYLLKVIFLIKQDLISRFNWFVFNKLLAISKNFRIFRTHKIKIEKNRMKQYVECQLKYYCYFIYILLINQGSLY